ncbi:MAG: hypothetical protein ACNYPE_03405 [Candidatus Azotimanducaceae bacterium WSBS_2022_MAG_OTU7]
MIFQKHSMIKKILITLAILIVLLVGALFTQIGQIVGLNLVTTTLFSVKGNTLTMVGLVNAKSHRQLRKVFEENPQIDTVSMLYVPGSVNDQVNLEMGEWLAQKEITMKISRYGLIASGGTDLFLAGKRRIVEEGAQIGVHSWADAQGSTAIDYPRGHENHQPYIDYYQDIGWDLEASEKFYYFTIEAASADDIYNMTDAEIIQYNVATESILEPESIFVTLEQQRAADGLSSISEQEAKERGIKIEETVSKEGKEKLKSIDEPSFFSSLMKKRD